MIQIAMLIIAVIAGFLVLLKLNGRASLAVESETSDGLLWVMIETNGYFRSNEDLAIEDEVIALMEE